MLPEQQHPLPWHFNSRPSARGDLTTKHMAHRRKYFNSRPSARGDAGRRLQRHSPEHFNSRPSARGDCFALYKQFSCNISIHAPPRGATRDADNRREKAVISIHAPPRGATRLNHEYPHQKNFNSRPSARGDSSASCRADTPPAISIHAPPRGATARRSQRRRGIRISIHAPPRGATYLLRISTKRILFQFTPLREGRRARESSALRRTTFNSRPSARGDAPANRQR